MAKSSRSRPDAASAAALDARLAEMQAARAAELAAAPPPTDAAVAAEATFLAGWAKGRRITPYGGGSTFHVCGKWMTKLTPKMVAALLASGRAVGTVDGFTVAR